MVYFKEPLFRKSTKLDKWDYFKSCYLHEILTARAGRRDPVRKNISFEFQINSLRKDQGLVFLPVSRLSKVDRQDSHFPEDGD